MKNGTFSSIPIMLCLLLFSPDGTMLATFSNERTGQNSLVRLWDPRAGKELNKIKVDPWSESLRFSSSGKILGVASSRSIQVLEMPSGKMLRRLEVGPAHRTWATAAFFPNGDKAIAWGEDNLAHVYDLSSGKELHAFGQADEREGPFVLSHDSWTFGASHR